MSQLSQLPSFMIALPGDLELTDQALSFMWDTSKKLHQLRRADNLPVSWINQEVKRLKREWRTFPERVRCAAYAVFKEQLREIQEGSIDGGQSNTDKQCDTTGQFKEASELFAE